jgi:hypothetical protein
MRSDSAKRRRTPSKPDFVAACLSTASEGNAVMLWRVPTSGGFVRKYGSCVSGQCCRVCSITAWRVNSFRRLPAPKFPSEPINAGLKDFADQIGYGYFAKSLV